MKVSVETRSGKPMGEYTAETVDELREAFAAKNPKYYVDRQRFTVKGVTPTVALKPGQALEAAGLKSGATLLFKDLGPQVSYQGVFLVEYFGPWLIMLVIYFFRAQIHGSIAEPGSRAAFVQDLAVGCWTAHYSKRLLETVFVHRFSHATMPILNIFKNSAYYWGAAAGVGYFLTHAKYTAPVSDEQVYLGLAIFVLSELGNLHAHIALRNLRPPGTRIRKIPRGFMFEFVSCPNYFFEVLAWIGFSIMCQVFAAMVFTTIGFGQMYIWAVGKHKNYRKEFDGKSKEKYPPGRKAMIPFLL